MIELLKHTNANDILVWVAVMIFIITQPIVGIILISMGLYYETNKRQMKISKYLLYVPFILFSIITTLTIFGVLL